MTKFTMGITGFSRDQQKQQLFDRQSSSDLRKKEKQSFLGAVAGCRLQAAGYEGNYLVETKIHPSVSNY